MEMLAYPNKRKIFLFSLLWIALLIVCLTPSRRPEMKVIAWGGVPISGIFLVFCSYMLFSSKPILVINRDGLWFHLSYVPGPVAWNDIARLTMVTEKSKGMKNKYLRIDFRDIDKYVARANVLQRVILRVNRSLGFTSLLIGQDLIAIPIQDIYHFINKNFLHHTHRVES